MFDKKKYQKEYYQKNKIRARIFAREYREKNKGRFTEYQHEYAKRNWKKYYDQKRDKEKQNARNRTKRKYGNPPKDMNYHHTTLPYTTDDWVIMDAMEHRILHRK